MNEIGGMGVSPKLLKVEAEIAKILKDNKVSGMIILQAGPYGSTSYHLESKLLNSFNKPGGMDLMQAIGDLKPCEAVDELKDAFFCADVIVEGCESIHPPFKNFVNAIRDMFPLLPRPGSRSKNTWLN